MTTRVTEPDATVLIVDDDREFARSAADYVQAQGFAAVLAHSLEQSRIAIMQGDFRRDLLLLDEILPDGSGFDLIDDLDRAEQSRVAIVTGKPSPASASRARSLPILDYLAKPLGPVQFDALLATASAGPRMRHHSDDPPAGIVAECLAMREVVEHLLRIAPTSASVLVVGESGTGKELIARALHERSRRDGPFVAVNCGAVTPDLLASHLFGHERGSFTGATNRHVGYFEQANRGTLFLDEITEMPAALQVYLLRVLETGTVTRVGGNEQIPIDVRIVAATNRDPQEAMEAGQLREDLFYRLADFSLELPPLRRRGNDLPVLAQRFVAQFNAQYGSSKQLADGFARVLFTHDWPGNVRELRSVVQRAFLLSDDNWVRLVPERRTVRWAMGPTSAVSRGARSADLSMRENGRECIVFSVGMPYADVEKQMLLKTLAHFHHDKVRTAAALGVSVRTIHNQLARLRAGEPAMPDR